MLSKIRQSGSTRLVVGFSGGIDSHVLLHVLARCELPGQLHALHVNHGLSPFAGQWQSHCEQVCKDLGVAFTAVMIEVSPGSGVEERARDARYQAFAGFLGKGDMLVLAHHGDDQVETALLTLFRGGNRPGLSGMPQERPMGAARLLRPLLDVDRARIEAYAVEHDLRWIVDQSNADTGMNRNYIRHRVLPVIRARWPDVSKTLRREIERDTALSQLIDNIGKNDIETILSEVGGVSVAQLKVLDPARRKNAVRFWISTFDLPVPGDALLSVELDAFLDAAQDAAPLLSWQGVCMRRAGDEVFITAVLPAFDNSMRLAFSRGNSVDTGIGMLVADRVKGRGLLARTLDEIEIRFRQGGEKIRLGRNRTLKNVFQEAGVPAWLRDCLPLIYIDEELVAVAGLPAWKVPTRIAAGHVAGEGQSGFEFRFAAPGQPYTH